LLKGGCDGSWREANNLNELQQLIQGCRGCRLAEERTNLVFGTGDPHARIMFVGEGPGFYEDQQGFPFVGQAGQFLDQLLASIGLRRAEVYIANCIKCRPPGNRDPLPEELAACTPYLFKQIELIGPRIICTLGNFATKTLLKTDVGITRLHGKRFAREGMVFVPLFHPAAALHKPPLKSTLIEDFQRLRGYLEESLFGAEEVPAGGSAGVGEPGGSTPGSGSAASGEGEASEGARQLGLF
jgi:uracil-DNA glycosylase family 4